MNTINTSDCHLNLPAVLMCVFETLKLKKERKKVALNYNLLVLYVVSSSPCS